MHNPRPDESIERIRHLENEAQSWKQKYELLLDGLADAVLIQDAGGRLVAANPAAVRLTGFNREQLLAMNFHQLLTPESWTGILGLMDQPRFSTVGEMVAQSGAVFAVELQAAVGRAADGSVTVQYVAREPAAWRPVEEALRHGNRLEQQLLQSQKMESLGRLAGGIAHDFNNLLMVIAGYSDLLLGALGNPEKLRHGLMEIKGAGDRGAELTRQLLTFSRKQITQPRVLSLNAVIQESKGLLDRATGKDIRLATSLEPAAWTIKADRGQMNQVLINLVVNSRNSMPAGGALTLDTCNVYLGSDLREEPEGAGTKPYLRLRIHDTGVGMDEQTRRHVFEPFFTAKGSRKGTGLGLATVFGIVTQSGGFIFVESEPGRGATFSVYFPRSDAAVSGDALAGAPRQALRGFGTVLVVEDQDQVRLLICTAL
ncbi:MAG TPA: ATP-binding protein, partial [Candidatus Solibacter sp.]|nr:ATP-binding protein [Candidatus Solibacter sp.]